MANAAKVAAVKVLTESFQKSSAGIVTEYRGLSVAQLRDLRKSLLGNAEYTVVKNTLSWIAAKEAGVEISEEILKGPTAIAFVTGDPVEAAKSLRDFSKDNPALVIKAGYMDGAALDAASISKLADLESREVLLAKMAGALKGTMSNAAALFAAPATEMARTIEALRAKREQEDAA